ncbi:hypothetical protein ACOHOT_000929 [Cronobacter sakazakii]
MTSWRSERGKAGQRFTALFQSDCKSLMLTDSRAGAKPNAKNNKGRGLTLPL